MPLVHRLAAVSGNFSPRDVSPRWIKNAMFGARVTMLDLLAVTMFTALGLAASCASNNCRCATDFEFKTVQVVDSNGTPAAGLTSSTVRLSDHKDVSPPDHPTFLPGEYAVVDDLNIYDFDETPEAISFSVTGAAGSASTTGTATSGECHCHVEMVVADYVLVID